ncbi:hypothetical protein B0H13DRAFT_1055231 [Mycena leptocephala]|nr:hypothetical protein B0H13DRAFT_1055231 [Mycena leptocephala]
MLIFHASPIIFQPWQDPSTGPTIQNALELLQRIDDQFSIMEKDGATFLLTTPAPSTSDEVSHTSSTTSLETHPSTWLAAEPHLPIQGSLIVTRNDFARNTRAPSWSSAQPPSQAMPMPIPNSSRRSRRSQYSDNSMPMSSSPEEADWASWAPPSSAPMNQYPSVASTSHQPQMPLSARVRQKSRKMEVDESNSGSDSEGTAKPHGRKKSSRH